jgi:hypothetical protein
MAEQEKTEQAEEEHRIDTQTRTEQERAYVPLKERGGCKSTLDALASQRPGSHLARHRGGREINGFIVMQTR